MTHRIPRLIAVLAFGLVAAGTLDARPGQLLKVTAVESLSPGAIDALQPKLFTDIPAPKALYPVDCFLLVVESTYLDDTPTPVTVQVFLPRLPDRAKRSLYVFAPGSTGLRDACRPSREHIAGIHWGLYRTHVLGHAGQGSIGVLPDYMGFGDPDPKHLQPYMVAVAEGRMLLDVARAMDAFLEQNAAATVAGTALFYAGFSQGGHAAFAAADMRGRYARDVRIAGIIGYGPSTDIPALFREFPMVAPMAIYSYMKVYGKEAFDPDLVLAPRWAKTLEKDVTRQCVGGMQSYYPASARELFLPEFSDALFKGTLERDFPSIEKILRENSTGLSGHRVPALILEGSDDIVVSPASQEAFARELCRTGCPVTYSLYKGRRHDTRQVGFAEARQWMDRITRGEKPESSCGDLR